MCWGTLPDFQRFKLCLFLSEIRVYFQRLFSRIRLTIMYPPWRNDGVEKGHCVEVNHFYFKRIFVYSMWSVFKVFIECVTMLLLFDILVYFGHRKCGIFSSLTGGLKLRLLQGKVESYSPEVNCFFVFFSPSPSPSFVKASTSLA